jgi:hypothetical protein
MHGGIILSPSPEYDFWPLTAIATTETNVAWKFPTQSLRRADTSKNVSKPPQGNIWGWLQPTNPHGDLTQKNTIKIVTVISILNPTPRSSADTDRRSAEPYRIHNQAEHTCDSSLIALMMEAIRSSETSVNTYRTTWRKITEHSRVQMSQW